MMPMHLTKRERELSHLVTSFAMGEPERPSKVRCPECDGHGWASERYVALHGRLYQDDCEYCDGEGFLIDSPAENLRSMIANRF